jgi:alpha-galactosidase/6-phospho-beta-glucosidase family protein
MPQTRVQHPKVVVIGAGSLFFGRQAIWQMVQSPHLNGGTLGLVDTDKERVEKLARLAEMAIEHAGVSLAVEASSERNDVLSDADFVVLSFADRTVKFRGIDCEVSEKHGIRMCSGDTIGPGGIFRAMREFPVILECAKDIQSLCPDAWVINYINPTAVHGIGLRKYAPKLKSFALCDSLHMPHVKRRYAVRAGILQNGGDYTEEIDRNFDLRIAGVNHFTWLVRAEFEGRDVMSDIAASIRRDAVTETDGGDKGAKAIFNNAIGYTLYEAFGHVPACVAHTKEYMRFWQGLGVAPEPIPPLSIWETEPRYQRHDAMWRQVDAFISGEAPIVEFLETIGPDHATDIIENMVGGLGKPFYINTDNAGAVSNMPDDAFLELLCDVDMDGPKPRPVGAMPLGLRGLQQQVLDTHELTADAVANCDFALVRRAMLTDPLVSSIADADAIIQELLEAERDALPACWYE